MMGKHHVCPVRLGVNHAIWGYHWGKSLGYNWGANGAMACGSDWICCRGGITWWSGNNCRRGLSNTWGNRVSYCSCCGGTHCRICNFQWWWRLGKIDRWLTGNWESQLRCGSCCWCGNWWWSLGFWGKGRGSFRHLWGKRGRSHWDRYVVNRQWWCFYAW